LIVSVEVKVKTSGEDKIMAIIREVTELRAVQRQVQISEARFRGAFEDSAIGMAVVDLKGKWIKVNRAFCAMTGYLEDDLLGLSFQDITHPDDMALDQDVLNRFADGEGGVFRFEKRYLHKKGSIIWANLNVSMIRDNAGAALYFVAQIEDITDEKKAREKLILSEANLNATINNTEIFIWSIDRSFNLLTFNKPFADYIKEQYGVVIERGKRIMDTPSTPESRELIEKWSEIYMRALAGEVVTLEENRFGKDFKYSVSPIIENTKVMGVSIFADNVTERNAQDRALTEAQRKIGELKLMALRSVMNPHFVFNVLNSIQYFIAKNDRINAINYLSTFSKLIRSILTHSVNNKIKLTEEIEMLKNYVHLEMTRFENKFSFDLQIDENVELDNIEIPSLLVQPYVENAILHGLYNKTGHGQLTIRVKEKNDAVFFEIEDDGVGREEALKIRSQNLPLHKSMGIKLTEERLKLINEAHNVAFEIEDLKNAAGPSGTKVTIGVKF
jgi:PAS domain S-box-containing protein